MTAHKLQQPVELLEEKEPPQRRKTVWLLLELTQKGLSSGRATGQDSQLCGWCLRAWPLIMRREGNVQCFFSAVLQMLVKQLTTSQDIYKFLQQAEV